MIWFRPRSLFGRNVLLILVLIVFAELAGALLFLQFIQRPRAEQLAGIAVRNLSFLRTLLSSVPEPERAAFMTQVNSTAGIEITRAPPRETQSGLLPDMATRVFAETVAAQLHEPASNLRWQAENGGSLWLPVQIGNERYWVGVHNLRPDGSRRWLWMAMSVLLSALALFGAYRIQRRINEPLNRLVDAARAMAGGQMPATLPEDGPTEIVTVSRSFNHMTQSLLQADRERALMLAGISHDLRTPLTKLRIGTEIMRAHTEPELMASMERSIADMDAIIDQFIVFARAASDAEQFELTDLGQLLRDCAQAYAQRGIAVHVASEALPLLRLRRNSMERALTNLLENAIRYARPEFEIRAEIRDECLILRVIDHGPGISEAESSNMKRPFVRGSTSRGGAPGAGLGLAIVERVAQSHGGKFMLCNREEGGLEAKLLLPVRS